MNVHTCSSEDMLTRDLEYVQRFATKEAADAADGKDEEDAEDDEMSDIGSISNDDEPAGHMDL